MANKIREVHIPTPSELIEKGSRTITGRTESPPPPKARAGLANGSSSTTPPVASNNAEPTT